MKRSPLQRKAHTGRKQAGAAEVAQRKAFHDAGLRQGCVMCRTFPVTAQEYIDFRPEIRNIQAHHVVPKRFLRRFNLSHEIWNPWNAMGLCKLHHDRHEGWFQRVPRELVPSDAVLFASSVGLPWLIDSEYP